MPELNGDRTGKIIVKCCVFQRVINMTTRGPQNARFVNEDLDDEAVDLGVVGCFPWTNNHVWFRKSIVVRLTHPLDDFRGSSTCYITDAHPRQTKVARSTQGIPIPKYSPNTAAYLRSRRLKMTVDNRGT